MSPRPCVPVYTEGFFIFGIVSNRLPAIIIVEQLGSEIVIDRKVSPRSFC